MPDDILVFFLMSNMAPGQRLQGRIVRSTFWRVESISEGQGHVASLSKFHILYQMCHICLSHVNASKASHFVVLWHNETTLKLASKNLYKSQLYCLCTIYICTYIYIHNI